MNNPVIDEDGTKRWYNEMGQLHRLDGPALIYKDGAKIWLQNDKYHRDDGPARLWRNGSEEWYIHGKRIKPILNIICLLRKKLKQ